MIASVIYHASESSRVSQLVNCPLSFNGLIRKCFKLVCYRPFKPVKIHAVAAGKCAIHYSGLLCIKKEYNVVFLARHTDIPEWDIISTVYCY